MVHRFNLATKAKARLALKALLAEGEGPRLRARWRRLRLGGVGWSLVGLCGGVLALALLGFGMLALRLSQGPIGLESLTPRIASSLEERFGGQYSFALGPTALERGENGATVSFQGVEIRDRAGRTLLAAPKGDISLDLLALATLEVKVKRLELVGLDLRMTVQPGGALSLEGAREPNAVAIDLPPPPAAAPDAPAPAFAAEIGPLVWNLVEAVTSQNQTLDRLGIAHGRLEVEDGATHRKVVFEDSRRRLRQIRGGRGAHRLRDRPAGRWSVAIHARGVGAHALSVEAKDLNLDDLLLATGRKPPFKATMPISAKVEVALAEDRSLAAMTGSFALGAGYLKLDDPDHKPLLIDEVVGGWRWDAAERRFAVENVQFFAGQTHVTFGGSLAPPTAADPVWTAAFDAGETFLGGDRPDEPPIRLDRARLRARYAPADQRLTVDDFSIAGPGGEGALSSEVVNTGAGPTLKLRLRMGRVPLLGLSHLWPTFLVADVRDWCIQNLRGGDLVSAALSIDWDAPTFATALRKQAVPADSIHGEFAAKDAAVQLLPGLPALAGLDGGGVVTGHEFSMSARRGFMDVAPGRRILAADIAFAVPDTSPKPLNPARASAHLQGSADALADLISRDALKPFVGLPIDPASVKGQFDGNLRST